MSTLQSSVVAQVESPTLGEAAVCEATGSTEPGSPPPYISHWEFDHIREPGVRGRCRDKFDHWNRNQPPEPVMTPRFDSLNEPAQAVVTANIGEHASPRLDSVSASGEIGAVASSQPKRSVSTATRKLHSRASGLLRSLTIRSRETLSQVRHSRSSAVERSAELKRKISIPVLGSFRNYDNDYPEELNPNTRAVDRLEVLAKTVEQQKQYAQQKRSSPERKPRVVGDPNRYTLFGDFIDLDETPGRESQEAEPCASHGLGSPAANPRRTQTSFESRSFDRSSTYSGPIQDRIHRAREVLERPLLVSDEEDGPSVVIDTFVDDGHTVWRATERPSPDVVEHHWRRFERPARDNSEGQAEAEEMMERLRRI